MFLSTRGLIIFERGLVYSGQTTVIFSSKNREAQHFCTWKKYQNALAGSDLYIEESKATAYNQNTRVIKLKLKRSSRRCNRWSTKKTLTCFTAIRFFSWSPLASRSPSPSPSPRHVYYGFAGGIEPRKTNNYGTAVIGIALPLPSVINSTDIVIPNTPPLLSTGNSIYIQLKKIEDMLVDGSKRGVQHSITIEREGKNLAFEIVHGYKVAPACSPAAAQRGGNSSWHFTNNRWT